MTLQMGKVTWFSETEGFGFISQADGSKPIYVNRRSIANSGNKSLEKGQAVEFVLSQGSRGPEATDVIAF